MLAQGPQSHLEIISLSITLFLQVDQGEDFEALLNRMSEAREQKGDAAWNEFFEYVSFSFECLV